MFKFKKLTIFSHEYNSSHVPGFALSCYLCAKLCQFSSTAATAEEDKNTMHGAPWTTVSRKNRWIMPSKVKYLLICRLNLASYNSIDFFFGSSSIFFDVGIDYHNDNLVACEACLIGFLIPPTLSVFSFQAITMFEEIMRNDFCNIDIFIGID